MEALIFENEVIQVEKVAFPIAPPTFWMTAPEGCEPGWIFDPDTKRLTAPPENLTATTYNFIIEVILDDAAVAHGYDNAASLASYIGSGNARWQQEAKVFCAWRDMCWEYAYKVINQLGNPHFKPPSIAQFKKECPSIVWP